MLRPPDWTGSAVSPAASGPLEGMEGGAGRPGSRPRAMTLIRCGREERPARPPPTAARRLASLATMPCGVSETGFAPARTPLSSSVRRGNPRFLPRQVRGWSSEAPALGWSGRHAGQGIGLRPPAPALGRGPAGEPTPHLRGRRTMPRSERAVTYCVHIVSIESYYPRGANPCFDWMHQPVHAHTSASAGNDR